MTKYEEWLATAARLHSQGEAFAIVTVLECHGSVPRCAGTKMLVGAELIAGTIGGGHLEYIAIENARMRLKGNDSRPLTEDYPLGAVLGQCCGGRITLLYEVVPAPRATLALFGAGHVGRALATILPSLPLRSIWIDSRAQEFPDPLPQGITCKMNENPLEELAKLPSGSFVVIMTHNHPLDFALCEAGIRRDDLAYLGVIGSQTKARRMRMRLKKQQLDDSHVHCPIGLADVPGKRPMEIAVSVAAQIIACYHNLMPNCDVGAEPQQTLQRQTSTANPDLDTSRWLDQLWSQSPLDYVQK